MRLLKEEGVAVDGMDVREALPAPVRSSWVGVQGALPLFADEPDPPPVERPISILPAEAQIQPISGSNPQPGSVRAADAATAQSRTAPRWAAFKLLGSALFSSTGSPPFYQNRTFQMTFGATIFLAAAGVAALMLQGGASDLSAAQSSVQSGAMNRAQVEMIVRNYILEHPEIIPEAIDRLQAKRMSSIVDRNRAELEKPFAGGFDGAKDGDVVLVEFFDYACGYCRASLPDIDRLLAQDKSLKVVYRELPILSDESGEAAKASLYAAKQGQYGRFHRALYAAGRPSKESIEAAAKKVGLDPAALASGMSAGDISAEIENNLRLAQSLQATGTPTWVVGDQVLSGAVGYDALKAAIAKARAAQN
jgi:protein-disulfide isomerase